MLYAMSIGVFERIRTIFPAHLINGRRDQLDCTLMLVVAILSSFISIIPYLSGHKLSYAYNGAEEEEFKAEMLNSMQTSLFQSSVISTIAVGILITVDFCLSNFMLQKWCAGDQGSLSHSVLISSLLIPSIFIYFVAIPQGSPEILVVCFQLRLCFALYAMVTHLSIFGSKIFRTKYMWMVYLFFQASICSRTYCSFTNTYYVQLFFFFIACCLCGFLFFLIPLTEWCIKLRSTPIKLLTTHDLSCTAYLALTAFFSTFVTILYSSLSFSNNTFLSSVTILGMLYTMAVSIIRSQIASYEVILTHRDLLETKGGLVRYFSHEIRSPLNIMFVGLDLLREQLERGILEDNSLEMVDELKATCSMSLDVLNELLVFGSNTAGHISLQKTQVSVTSLLQDSVGPLQQIARSCDVQLLECSSGDGSLTAVEKRKTFLRVDVKKFCRVMHALLTHTLRRCPPGSVVSISTSVVTRGGDKRGRGLLVPLDKVLCLTLEDNGRAMAKDELRTLFSDEDACDTNLSMCKMIMDLHQGSIVVTPVGPTGGYIFTLDIPFASSYMTKSSSSIQELPSIWKSRREMSMGLNSLVSNRANNSMSAIVSSRSRYHAPVHPQAPNHSTASAHIPESESDAANAGVTVESLMDATSCGSMRYLATVNELQCSQDLSRVRIRMRGEEKAGEDLRVLVVDDSAMNRRMLVRAVSQEYSGVEEAADGAVAVEKVTAAQTAGASFDVILMDFQMPIMDGPTATEIIRGLNFGGPIIGVTGNALPADVELFLSKGADQVMLKPVSAEDLRSAIRMQLLRRSQSQSLVISRSEKQRTFGKPTESATLSEKSKRYVSMRWTFDGDSHSPR